MIQHIFWYTLISGFGLECLLYIYFHEISIWRQCRTKKAINSLTSGRVAWNFHIFFYGWWLKYSLWNCHQLNVTEPYWWKVNIGSDNKLDAIIQDAINWANVDIYLCHHMIPLDHNELISQGKWNQLQFWGWILLLSKIESTIRIKQ